MTNRELTLIRDCEATIVPAGNVVTLEKGSVVYVKQALGGTVTVQNEVGLFRISNKDIQALGSDVVQEVIHSYAVKKPTEPFSEAMVWEALKKCYDPEIPINIVDLGLIYDLSITPKESNYYAVAVKMTLTAVGCGMGPVIAEDARQKIEEISQVESAKVSIVWDPAWNPQMISEDGKKALGIV